MVLVLVVTACLVRARASRATRGVLLACFTPPFYSVWYADLPLVQYADAERDPFAAILLYVALGPSKHSVLTQLFRLSKHSAVFNFLSQDPTEEKCVASF